MEPNTRLSAQPRRLGRLPRQEKGIGLIELLIAVGIIGGILLVVLQMGTNMRTDSTVRNEAALLNTIAENIRGLYSGNTNYSGFTHTVARNARVFPGQMDDGSTVYNAWDGEVTTAVSNDLSGNADRAFTIAWTDIPEAACTKMATSNTTAAQVTVGSTVVTDAEGVVQPADAATACVGNTATDITWLFERN
jgi:type II secretory pathway pseudopilin PulG